MTKIFDELIHQKVEKYIDDLASKVKKVMTIFLFENNLSTIA